VLSRSLQQDSLTKKTRGNLEKKRRR